MIDLKNVVIKEKKVDTILTKSNLPIAGYSINPYVGCPFACRYCYATFMKRFTNHKEDWGMFLDVKYWNKINNPQKYKRKTMIIGSVTDGYNDFEAKYKRTRTFLEEMQGSGINLIVTTKSNLVTRDIDLIKNYPNPLVSWSMNTLDERFKKDMENTPTIKSRIEAMKQIHDEGIRTTCFISPIFPGITDVFSIIEEIKDFCDYIWLENLNLRGSFKGTIMNYIKEKYPALYPLYDEIYNKKNISYWEMLDKQVEEYANKNRYMYVIDEEPFLKNPTGKPIIINYFYHEKIRQSSKKR